MGGQVGFWAILLVPIARTLESVRAWWRPRSVAGHVGVVVGCTAAVGVAAGVLVDFQHGLPGYTAKVDIVTALGAGVAGLAAAGVACVACGVEEIERGLAASEPMSNAVWEKWTEAYLYLRAALDGLLACTAAIIGAAILSTGALRNATIAWRHSLGSTKTADAIFPQEQVLAYGIIFSVVLALLYLPVYERLNGAARQLRDTRAPLIWPPDEQWRERADERSMLNHVLKLDQSATTSFRLAAGVLAPLASSVISRALG